MTITWKMPSYNVYEDILQVIIIVKPMIRFCKRSSLPPTPLTTNHMALKVFNQCHWQQLAPPDTTAPLLLLHHCHASCLTTSHPLTLGYKIGTFHVNFFFSKKLFIIIHPVTTHTKKNIKNIYNHSGDVRYPDLSEIPTFTTSKNSSSSTPHTAVWQCCTAGQYSVRTEVQLDPVRSSTVPSCMWSLSSTCNQSCTVCWICS